MKPARIALLTSGGDAPGMNAAIRAIVRTAAFHGIRVTGVRDGYDGLVRPDLTELGPRSVRNIIQRGGTMLRSARSEAFRTVEGRATAAKNLRDAGIDALICIGGGGTQAGAHQLAAEQGVRLIGVATSAARTSRSVLIPLAIRRWRPSTACATPPAATAASSSWR